ncbi:hypothetical protein [Methanococcoides sp. NM1]|uniref:hypothetical protein n=1 Tax=Methanococcoides sp. NM1 TaxID=1201013 RepID=UPI001082EE81|nr:hypothetical protein [Methanococcoides sp. NM1]
MLQRESLNAWLVSIEADGVDEKANPIMDNCNYCETLIERYCEIQEDHDLSSKLRRLYLDDLPNPPDSFKIVSRFGEIDKD